MSLVEVVGTLGAVNEIFMAYGEGDRIGCGGSCVAVVTDCGWCGMWRDNQRPMSPMSGGQQLVTDF